MGLCKCRTVTTLFCFDHRKNVCENCVLNDHPLCFVKTYLQWLQNSEFDPNCPVCHESFSDGRRRAIRLPCFDLLHWECLEGILKESETTVGKSRCPICRVSILNTGADSPLNRNFRKFIKELGWEDQLPPSPMKTVDRDAAIVPGLQPNTPMISIEISPHRDLPHRSSRPPPPTPRIKSQLKSVLFVGWNFLTLRNVRSLSCGVSPRQSLLVLVGLVALLFLSINVIIPLFHQASHVI